MKPIAKNDPLMRMVVSYYDRIIKQMRRFEHIDLSVHDLPIRMVLRDGEDADFLAEEFFLDKVTYIDDDSFVIEVTGMTDNPDKYTPETIEAARIERAPGSERRFVICRDSLITKLPHINLLALFQIMRLLERTSALYDNELLAVTLRPFAEDESEIEQLMADLEQLAQEVFKGEGKLTPFLNSNWLS